MRNFKLVLAYDGSAFHGWQRQPGLRTAQDTVEQAVRRVVRHQVAVIGSGRTDSGVHAAGQVANFFSLCRLPALTIFHAIGSRLPKDITLIHLCEAPLSFHATHSALSKLYRYRIYNAPGRPVEHQLAGVTYHFWHPLDTAAMSAAAERFCGTHDFTAMASSGNDRIHNVRTVIRCEVYRAGLEVRVDIEGTGFLYNQVRNMVGTLVEVGRGRWPPQRVTEILESRTRAEAGPTLPARGLSLQWVRYDMPGLPTDAASIELEAAERWDSPAAVGAASSTRPVLPAGVDTEEEPSG